jgi:hypothetical protein
MYYPGTDTARQLARERQEQLKRDWQLANAERPEPVEARGRLDFRRVRRLRVRLSPTVGLVWRPRT